MTSAKFEIETLTSEETRGAGMKLAGWLQPGDVVLLHGNLGAGKTTLAQGIAAGLGLKDLISSPSFILVNEYEIPSGAISGRLYHVDLYRLQDSGDLESFGFSEIVAPTDAVTLVEWPERALDLLPDDYLLVEFGFGASDQRTLRFSVRSASDRGHNRLAELEAILAVPS